MNAYNQNPVELFGSIEATIPQIQIHSILHTK